MIKQERFSKTGVKIAAVIITVIIVGIVFSNYLPGIQRFYIMVFSAFIGVPTLWIVLREEKSGDRGEIDMFPEDITRLRLEEIHETIRNPDWVHPDVRAQMKRLKDEQERLEPAEKSDKTDEK